MLLRVDGRLDITVDDYFKSKIDENPLIQPLMMDAGTLISSTSKVSSDDDLESHMANLERVPEPVKKIL